MAIVGVSETQATLEAEEASESKAFAVLAKPSRELAEHATRELG